jgi:hypothetical protein
MLRGRLNGVTNRVVVGNDESRWLRTFNQQERECSFQSESVLSVGPLRLNREVLVGEDFPREVGDIAQHYKYEDSSRPAVRNGYQSGLRVDFRRLN